ncbi:hypothetical protein [Bradyrhizobium sp.]|uniref:hypothetical protein n=1 Tax=Bradyrhizobium sp. TaxID=376 RepID=UPI001EC34124|nr:hypothetical protein [Bradyrhizobium sp.]MBV9984642.1 hypothetical protein [Bradyrhizobium sp.]
MPAAYPDGSPIIVNGRPLLVPEKNYSLQQQIDAAHYQASRGLAAGALTREWFLQHVLLAEAEIRNGKQAGRVASTRDIPMQAIMATVSARRLPPSAWILLSKRRRRSIR